MLFRLIQVTSIKDESTARNLRWKSGGMPFDVWKPGCVGETYFVEKSNSQKSVAQLFPKG